MIILVAGQYVDVCVLVLNSVEGLCQCDIMSWYRISEIVRYR